MTDDHIILGIHVTDRLEEASAVQAVFTEFGCNIKTRVGLHEVADNYCAGEGVVLLELIGGPEVRKDMMAKLRDIQGIEAKEMVFSHE